MPDNGSVGYTHLNADGTVVVPTNMTIAGVIEGGDLATHADVSAAVDTGIATAETYTDNAVADRVIGAGNHIGGPYSVDFPSAALAPGQSLSVDDGPYGELAWAQWSLSGHFVPAVICKVSYPEITLAAAPNSLTFTIVNINSVAEAVQGTFYFSFIGLP